MRRRAGYLLAGLLMLLAGGCASSGGMHSTGPVHYDWGPFAASWTDVHGNERTRIMGPFGETSETQDGWSLTAVRPLSHRWGHEEKAIHRREILWPVGTFRQREDAAYWRALMLFRWNWDVTDEASRHRTWLFPFIFQGRTTQGEDYFAFFPFGGTIKEFAFWDQIDFALFPVWVRSRINDIEAHSWLWPFISYTEGPGTERFRVFPLYGYNEREGRGRKQFILWPFWNQVTYTIPGAEGQGWILFPVTGHLKLADQETWWFMPPLFRYTKSEQQSKLLGPWPFVQQGEGEIDKFYLWPLYGRKTIGGVDNRFYLWPLGSSERVENEYGTVTRNRFLPVYRRYTRDSVPELEADRPDETWTKIWPVYSHLSKPDLGVRRTVVPDLNPMRGGPIERNYAPFWQLYVREEVQGDVDTELLWGFYRSVKRGDDFRYRSLFPFFSWSDGEDSGHFSILKGLVAKDEAGGKKQWRVLYLFRFGDKDQN